MFCGLGDLSCKFLPCLLNMRCERSRKDLDMVQIVGSGMVFSAILIDLIDGNKRFFSWKEEKKQMDKSCDSDDVSAYLTGPLSECRIRVRVSCCHSDGFWRIVWQSCEAWT